MYDLETTRAHTHTHIYIYTHVESQRGVYMYIYIYMYMYMCPDACLHTYASARLVSTMRNAHIYIRILTHACMYLAIHFSFAS